MPNKKLSPTGRTVLTEVKEAYFDCWTNVPFEEAKTRRKLDFRASKPVSRDEAVTIMTEACPQSYNEFKASLLKLLPADAKITIAREGSPCVYVEGQVTVSNRFMHDERHYYPATPSTPKGETRFWWD